MQQTKKTNQWHFGMEAHIGVGADSGLVHSVIGTAANIHNITYASGLLHSEEKMAFVTAGTKVSKSTWKLPISTGRLPCDQASAGDWIKTRHGTTCLTKPNNSRSVSFQQGPLQRACQEQGTTDNTVCLAQLVDGQKTDYSRDNQMSATARGE